MLSNFMKLVIAQNSLFDSHYVEVYAGGASIAWSLLFEEYAHHVHINDIDPAIYAFWASVLFQTEGLSKLIRDTAVTMRTWHHQRYILGHHQNHSILETGFAAFFLNRTNRSGIIRGGVIGGKCQAGPWKLDARFNKQDLIQRIVRIARYADRISLYNLDAIEILRDITPGLPLRSLIYLDPPYYSRGSDLYEHHYAHSDHLAISQVLATFSPQPWIVTYDSSASISRLYRGYRKIRYNLSYSAQGRYSGAELMFFSNNLTPPKVAHPARVRRYEIPIISTPHLNSC